MSKSFPHGIDITAPGGLAALFAFNRARFGDAVMEVDPPTPPEPAADPTPGDPAGNDDEPLRAEGLKALKAERTRADQEAQKAAALQKKLDDIEAEKLSDVQKAERKAQDAEARANALDAKALRLEAIAEYSVPKKYQHLVHGTDADSYATSAKAIAELATAAEGKAPKPDPVPGSGDRSGDNNPAGGINAARRRAALERAKS